MYTLMHKSNNIYTGSMFRKLQNADEKIKGLNKWRNMFIDWYNTGHGINMSVLPRVIYLQSDHSKQSDLFNTIPIKILEIFLVDMEEIILKFIC